MILLTYDAYEDRLVEVNPQINKEYIITSSGLLVGCRDPLPPGDQRSSEIRAIVEDIKQKPWPLLGSAK